MTRPLAACPNSIPRLPLAIASVILSSTLALVASSTTAHAESYVSLGAGGASTDGDLRGQGLNGDVVRIGIGQRFGRLALEANIAGASYSADGEESIYGTTTASVGLKVHLGITGPIEIYLKGGLNKTWDSDELSGRGMDLGLGLQWNVETIFASAAVWFDVTNTSTELANDNGARREGNIGAATLGVSVGF